ncbi:hypothetical protein B0H66DRAFT_35167 [Apodospora peruviana]|uniref:3-beta hydroxysteroid dehydrogenase/isomerase domain-containing protein n=1 Tax=Apodospora peruviana TaxID=516989 RepID=A0AAE0MG33_9PEZI|nr:hypothetical protein B0H66DRAFT_35167 [Apodospora peruviana]
MAEQQQQQQQQQEHPLLWAALTTATLVVLYLYRINQSMKAVPPSAAAKYPQPWTPQQVQQTFDRIKRNRLDFSKHLPPALERRYVVVGGSGLVGGDIVLQLLQRGQSPQSIRIVDFQPLTKEKMLLGGAGACDLVKADISSSASVEAAFAKPWPESESKKPLTVFHTAAMIRPAERKWVLYDRIRKVNVVGTANVLAAARKVGAGADTIFIATSSSSVALRPVKFWGWPWRSTPKDYVQIFTESDFDAPIRPHGEFFANYGYSKAEAERLVCGANEEGFRTGVLRPGNGIYGDFNDTCMGSTLGYGKTGPVTSWTTHIIQNFVNSRNVALAHLQFEAALALPGSTPKCAGRPYLVTDPGQPVRFGELYRALDQLAVTPLKITLPPPVMMLLFAHAIEAWSLLLAYLPVLTKEFGWKEPAGLISNLQPAIFTPTAHTIADDSAARRSVEDGGLGYRGVCDTLEGMCDLIVDWNEREERNGGSDKTKAAKGAVAAVLPTPEPVGA